MLKKLPPLPVLSNCKENLQGGGLIVTELSRSSIQLMLRRVGESVVEN